MYYQILINLRKIVLHCYGKTKRILFNITLWFVYLSRKKTPFSPLDLRLSFSVPVLTDAKGVCSPALASSATACSYQSDINTILLCLKDRVATGRLAFGFRKWFYNLSGFNKYGLMRDDTLYEDADVKEALKRLPENLYNERMFRIKRALDLSMKAQILPQNQWTKFEEDTRYLLPYLNEVIRERKEKEEWMKK
uniref:Cytochrome b-c1 complex subunit 7 n=1 Tax=Echeneis naucrates TaxID=173247 RepID=A0A665TUR7_ECHNA